VTSRVPASGAFAWVATRISSTSCSISRLVLGIARSILPQISRPRVAALPRRGLSGGGDPATSEQTRTLLVATPCSAATGIREANAIPEEILEGHDKS